MKRCYVAALIITLLVARLTTLFAASEEKKPMTETQKIEALIKHVEQIKDAKFIRNDTEYDAKTAAKFLRGKWKAKEAEITTANEFIKKVASVSSTTGKAYLLRFKDGKKMKISDYLLEELKKLGKSSPKK